VRKTGTQAYVRLMSLQRFVAMRRSVVPVVVPVVVSALVLAGCSTQTPGHALVTGESAQPLSGATTSSAAPPPPEDVQANELGLVPVLMYHRIVPDPTSVYERTAEDFRAELERLATEGYVPVTTAEFTTGKIDIPAGKHPVVLTFDDGDPTVLTMGPGATPARGSAIGILLEVAKRHPGFRPVASVYVNSDPFGGGAGGEQALRWLRQNGFEVGNHTIDHSELGSVSTTEAQRSIAEGDAAIRRVLPGYRPSTLALPFGSQPEPADLALHGPGYDYTGALLVGANPAPSPYSAEFEPAAIPRIRSQDASGQEAEYTSTAWLDKLAANPDIRYTSDGDPNRISYPEGSGSPADRFADSAQPY
jgi:peptidoglycan/xylan/chitin deacetylase (PgdA/CDA1 family)